MQKVYEGDGWSVRRPKHQAPSTKSQTKYKNKFAGTARGDVADGTRRKNLKDAAKARGLVASTIVKHLEELAEVGKLARADFAHLVPLDATG